VQPVDRRAAGHFFLAVLAFLVVAAFLPPAFSLIVWWLMGSTLR
jgi:hypothetical protein